MTQGTGLGKVRKVMILLPCSARKPYRLSKSHSQFRRAIASTGCPEVMMTSPFGLVPRDLEDVWPAANYDVPVTGEWSKDELEWVQRMLLALVGTIWLQTCDQPHRHGPDFSRCRCGGHPSRPRCNAHDALQVDRCRQGRGRRTFDLKNQKNSLRLKEHFKSIARKTTQTDAWCEDLVVRGKLPRWRLELNGTQVAVWSIDRNGFSFSVPRLTSCTNTGR